MPFEQFEQPPKEAAKKEETMRVAFETKEGEKFFAERLINPDDPRVKKVQEMLAGHFGKKEVDPLEVMKGAMTGRMETGEEVPPYLIHIAENSKGKINGVHTGAVVETVDSRGNMSEKSGVSLGCYTLVSPEMRGRGVWKALFKAQQESATRDAERRGIEIKGFIGEANKDIEPILNKVGIKRAYIKTKDGSFRELPYEQPPLDWDSKTGKPAKGAGTVPELLVLKLASGENNLSGKKLMEMVRGMYYYNNYREEGYFKTPKAYERHTEFVEGIEQKLADFIGRRRVHLLSAQEREAAKARGIKFVEHMKKEK